MLVDPDNFASSGGDVAMQTDVKYKTVDGLKDRYNHTKSRRAHPGDLRSDHDLRWTANSMYSGGSVELVFSPHLFYLPAVVC